MDDRLVEVEVQTTAKDYRRALFWFHRWRFIGFAVILGFFFSMLGIGMIAALLSNKVPTAIFLPLLIPIALFMLIFVVLLLNIRSQAKNIEKIVEPTRFYFTKEGLESVAASSTVMVLWKKFYKIQETKTDFLFFPQKNLFYPVPKRFFHDEMQITELRQLIRESTERKAKLLHC